MNVHASPGASLNQITPGCTMMVHQPPPMMVVSQANVMPQQYAVFSHGQMPGSHATSLVFIVGYRFVAEIVAVNIL